MPGGSEPPAWAGLSGVPSVKQAGTLNRTFLSSSYDVTCGGDLGLVGVSTRFIFLCILFSSTKPPARLIPLGDRPNGGLVGRGGGGGGLLGESMFSLVSDCCPYTGVPARRNKWANLGDSVLSRGARRDSWRALERGMKREVF
eukprot:CAMPEP_0168805894 /NCGR_PEP_ID=MMETSP0726-20121227/1263_1 /TAXON_ID=265536 /ORGANISM="Amphiprora sp., Strain CCMP467" /LENGTH=142 /DNA_ID=CAMNT_0008857777 /DNA_START=80 /DNA_END=506 /DNA_ORIENTATION=-